MGKSPEDLVDLGRDVPALLNAHQSIRDVRLVGSRAEGRATEISDWDFAVETSDFQSVARDLPWLVEPLQPIAKQWDPLSEHYAYMLMLRGPIKIDLNFREPHVPAGPWLVTAATLPEIDAHFWDWILWLTSKQKSGHTDLVAAELAKMRTYLLRPLSVGHIPRSIKDAVAGYREAREGWERRLGHAISRELEHEVLPLVERMSQ